MCIYTCIKDCISYTKNLKSDRETLFIGTNSPHNEFKSPQTISRWVKTTVKAAGIDTTIFTAKLKRSAAASKAFKLELEFDLIRKTAALC